MFLNISLMRTCSLVFIILAILGVTYGAERKDICKTNPCANKGICVQTSYSPLYKCQCYGTGFHGPRCKQKCPKMTDPQVAPGSRRTSLPVECIVI